MRWAAWVVALSSLAPLPAAHADERIGPEISLAQTTHLWGVPRVASDGLGALVVWGGDYGPYTLYSARVDGAGVTTGPFVIAAGPELKRQPEIATDGRTALVVWTDSSADGVNTVKAMRLDSGGAPLDSTAIIVDSRRAGSFRSLNDAHVAFDGAMFRVVWVQSSGRNRVYTRRVGLDGGTFGHPRRVRVRYMADQPYEPNLSCRGAGECLLTWLQTAGMDAIEGVRIQGDRIADREVRRFLNNARDYEISSDGTDYMIIGTRLDLQGCDVCPQDAVAGRVSGAGVPLDGDGVRVNNRPSVGLPFVADVGLAFDGGNYVATFLDYASPCGYNLYGARIAPDGSVLNPDVPGSPLVEGGTAGSAAIAATYTHAVTAWQDLRPATCDNAQYLSTYARRAMPHLDTSGTPVVEIGTIGARSVPEQGILRFRLGAPGLDAANTQFDVSTMPAGAVFDAATQVFQWKPNPDQAGVDHTVHFAASDGVNNVSEDVRLTVTESSLAMCGTVEDDLSAPVANVAVQLKGRVQRPRTVFSDANGHFCFYYLIQDKYTLTVGKPSRTQYDASPLTVVMGGSDTSGVRFVVQRIR